MTEPEYAPFRLHLITTQGTKAPPFDALGQPLPQWFSDASDGELTIEIPDDASHGSSKDTTACTSSLLHEILCDFVPAPAAPSAVHDLAVIIARKWGKPLPYPLYGVMFDYNGTSELGTFDDYGVPRQACAIFVDAFDGLGDREKVRAVIHELGHVFNLTHDKGKSFMTPEVWTTGFKKEDGEKLALAAECDPRYGPGLSNFKDDAGARGPVRSQTRASEAWKLTASVIEREHILGEPVVLELELRSRGRKTRHAPEELDPGHPSLRIWIETPSGELRRYRPIVRFCRGPGPDVKLGPGDRLSHNPRISLGAGGFQFQEVGRHRVWAEFYARGDSDRRGWVRSNTCSVAIANPRGDDREISRALRHSGVAFFLAHRGGYLSAPVRRRLEQAAYRNRANPALRHAHYALAQAAFRDGAETEAHEYLERLDDLLASTREGFEPSLGEGAERLKRTLGRGRATKS